MIYFAGSSHAANHLREAARTKGLPLVGSPWGARLIFVSEDMPTDEFGNRDTSIIGEMVRVLARYEVPIVLTSQVPPGFTRSLGIKQIWHQAETLRILDAEERAAHPEQIIVGGEATPSPLYTTYLLAWDCPILRMSWEEAEFAKIAINMFLASQVDTTNRLASVAQKLGVDWTRVAKVLANDKRIGKYAYLRPGRWQDSKHLLRDHVTLKELEK
jgi:UDP-glucose 6-dehydrogenase